MQMLFYFYRPCGGENSNRKTIFRREHTANYVITLIGLRLFVLHFMSISLIHEHYLDFPHVTIPIETSMMPHTV